MRIQKPFIIANFLSLILISKSWEWHSYRSLQQSMKISNISYDKVEWIRDNCGVKRDIIREKRDTTFKLYGGQETQDFQLPWAVGIEMYKRVFVGPEKTPAGYRESLCSGSLISNKHVLTAQHCFTNFWDLSENETRLLYGSETYFKSKITVGQGNPTQDYQHVTEELWRYVPQRDYFSVPIITNMHDWALLELRDEVPGNLTDIKAIVPVCLPANNEPLANFVDVEAHGQGGIEADPDETSDSLGIMRYIHATIESTTVYRQHVYLWRNLIGIHSELSRPGDSGGGISKAVQTTIRENSVCKHVLVGIIQGPELGLTLAVDARTITDEVQRLTGIRA